ILDELVVCGLRRSDDDRRSGCRSSGEQRASRPGRLHRGFLHGFRYRSAHSTALKFPENRENNREFLTCPVLSALSVRTWHPFRVQFRYVAVDSLFSTEQGNCFAETGNSSVGNQELPYPIPKFVPSFKLPTRIPRLNRSPVKLNIFIYTMKLRIRRVSSVVFRTLPDIMHRGYRGGPHRR